jgi:DNA-directed RNA polymerase subunit RPC12/RpoP
MPTELAVSGMQHSDRSRVIADFWGEHNLYCPNCKSPALKRGDSEAGELHCPDCESRFQIKGHAAPFGKSAAVGEFDTVTRALRTGRVSGYFFLHYDESAWTVRDLLLVPAFAIPTEAIARRGDRCYLVFEHLPAEARIAMITTIRSASPGGTECIMISRSEEVREKFKRLKPRQGKRGRVAA